MTLASAWLTVVVGSGNEQESAAAFGHGLSAAPCRSGRPLPTSAFGAEARPMLSFLEPISLGVVVGIGPVVGIVVRCREGRTVTSKHRNKPDMPSVWIVVAAFNEAAVLSPIVSDLVRRSYRVVVVDDGSHDGTGQIAFSAGATVVAHLVNPGQGAALQTGINFALQQGADYVVTFDADGQHRPSDIARLIDALVDHDAVRARQPIPPRLARHAAAAAAPGAGGSLAYARYDRSSPHRYPQWLARHDPRGREPHLITAESHGACQRAPRTNRGKRTAPCRGACDDRLHGVFVGERATPQRFRSNPV